MANGDPPSVTSVSPTWVPSNGGGVEITLTGTGFTGATTVTFADLAADFVVDSDTQIRATAPDASSKYTSSSQLEAHVTTPGGASSGGNPVQFGEPPS
jgi:hypothetical protein